MTSDEISAEFPVTISQPVQWGDQDGFGHVNNTHFIGGFESARVAYLLKCGIEMSAKGIGPILAAVHCNFRRQIQYPDTVIVGARVTRLGRSSITIEHKLWSERQSAVAADGTSTVVVFDYQSQQSTPISAELRAIIESVEGRFIS